MTSGSCLECGGPFTGDHRQIGLTGEYGVHAHIDIGIAPLIAACWAAGIATNGSCEDIGNGRAALGFVPGHAERFVGATTGSDLDDESPDDRLAWRMRTLQMVPDWDGAWYWLPASFAWAASFGAWFPASDMPELTRRLERWR
jgi:hypothetical protein